MIWYSLYFLFGMCFFAASMDEEESLYITIKDFMLCTILSMSIWPIGVCVVLQERQVFDRRIRRGRRIPPPPRQTSINSRLYNRG